MTKTISRIENVSQNESKKEAITDRKRNRLQLWNRLSNADINAGEAELNQIPEWNIQFFQLACQRVGA